MMLVHTVVLKMLGVGRATGSGEDVSEDQGVSHRA